MISPLPARTAGRPVTTVAVTGTSVHLPAAAGEPGGLPRLPGMPEAPALAPACPPEQAHTVLGRKGLLYKEPSTRLALCAVHRALGLADGARPQGELCRDTAVVAASNLGNLQTVVEVARTVAREGGRGVSPMAAPNASSNIIASSVALWFRFGGPNLMVCSGATAGLDAVALGVLLLRAGRARRVVVVGAEPDDEIARAVHLGVPGGDGPPAPLRAGAACVILQAGDVAAGSAPLLSMVEVDGAGQPGWPGIAGAVVGPGAVDPASAWGDCYGAQGVLQVAIAAQLAGASGAPVGVRCGSPVDGWRAAWLRPAGEPAGGLS